jgi:hypothetical protein
MVQSLNYANPWLSINMGTIGQNTEPETMSMSVKCWLPFLPLKLTPSDSSFFRWSDFLPSNVIHCFQILQKGLLLKIRGANQKIVIDILNSLRV